MRFKVKNIEISTGSIPIVIMDRNECLGYDIHLNERVRVKNLKNHREVIATVDFYDSHLPKNHILLMSEVTKKLGIRNGEGVELARDENPLALKYIKEKLKGEELGREKIEEIIKAVVSGRLTDIDLTYFVSSCYIRGLSNKEIVALTSAIVDTGERLNLKSSPHEHIYDKHCVGGVAGNRTTMCVIPIVAAYGLKIPKTSSRAITSPAGTADTMEVLAEVCLDSQKLREVVHKTNACLVWGGSLNLAPADDKIIRIEHPLSIDTNGLMISSILAKKLSVGSTHILIDIPYGEYSKISSKSRAKNLRKLFIQIGKKLGLRIKVILTDGTEPIGNGVGPLLEALDVLKVLKNDLNAPKDLREKTIYMATELLEMHIGNKRKAREIVVDMLNSGKAYEKFMDIISAQGKKKVPALAKFHADAYAKHSGKIVHVNNNEITRIARFCGAPKTKEAGMFLRKKVGDIVKIGEPLATLYANNEESLKYALEYFNKSNPYNVKF